MNAGDLLHQLQALGVVLIPEGDRLRIDAPAGVLTPDLRQALATQKSALLQLLSQPAGTSVSGCARCQDIEARAREVLGVVRPCLPRGLQRVPDEQLLHLAAWSLMVSFERALRKASP